jgi:ketosteroid isomerase-like protein
MRDHEVVTVTGNLLALVLCLGAGVGNAAPIEDPELRSLVEAERAFARMSVEKGMQVAFLANLAPDAIVFRPGPVPAVTWFEEHPQTSGALEWAPDFAAIAGSGDLGYTSGPWSYRDQPANEPVTGHFVSVWRRGDDGVWKVVLDTGVRHDPTAGTGEVTLGPRSAVRVASAGGDARAATMKALLDVERALSADASAHGRLAAIGSHAAEDVRMYISGVVPVVGRDAVRALDARHDGMIEWTPSGSGASREGDLGYVYGTALRHPKGAAADSVEATAFMRIWRRGTGGAFEIVLDISPPMPAPKPEAKP